MRRPYIIFFIQTIILIFIQAILLNHIRLFGYFTPIVYLFPLFKLPIQTPKWVSVILASLVGFFLDLLMNTPGLNMAVSSIIGLIRTPILRSLMDEELLEEEELVIIPSNTTLTIRKYQSYLILITFIHIALLMLMEAFSINIFRYVLPNILGSFIISYIIFLLFDAFIIKKKESL